MFFRGYVQYQRYLLWTYKNSKPATVISTDSNFPLCKGKDNQATRKLKSDRTIWPYKNLSLTHLQLQTSKIGHKLQSYPVNLALKVSSMTLLLISNRIILNNENCSEFHKASSLKTLKLFDGIQDGRRELLLVTWCWFSFRVPQRLPRFFNFPLFFSLIPRDSYI